MNKLFSISAIVLLAGCAIVKGGNDRQEMSLNENWRLWHDQQAEWVNDSLYLPENVNIQELAAISPIPTGGWEALNGRPEGVIDVSLPALVEEYLTPDGHVDTHLPGVFWFWKDVEIPESWAGKILRLNIGSYRLRIEVYVNETLTGYDIVGEVPYSCELTQAIQYGKTNRIAIRITNPGGVARGWRDSPMFQWGKYNFASSRHFGGISGNVKLIATDSIYVEDVYVKNLNTPDYRTIAVRTTVHNRRLGTDAEIRYEIIPASGGKTIYEATEKVVLSQDKSVHHKTISCPKAALWNIETPELYLCRVTVFSDGMKDTYDQKFGFRVFEVKPTEDNRQAHFYFNGKRIIYKSGIDFSYYAFTGLHPTDEMVEKTVLAAKQIGQNGINFHRQIGLPPVFEKADELGLFTYEETGGNHEDKDNFFVSQQPFAAALMLEKWRRMVIRDRNHPSLLIYNLQNESPTWNDFRQQLMEMAHDLDEGKLITASSGGMYGGDEGEGAIHHIRPYENQIRRDYTDEHTVEAGVWFDEKDFNKHVPDENHQPHFWGEVKCYSAPDNWHKIAVMYDQLKAAKPARYKGYNYSHYLSFAQKIKEFFNEHGMNQTGSGVIQAPGDIPTAASGGKMYNDGRNAQNIMSYDDADGYVINAWSGGNGLEGWISWYSGIVDDGRNIKGDPAIYAYYTRPLQVVIQRKTIKDGVGGKTFDVSGKLAFKIKLINQGILPAGNYTLRLKLKDGVGKYNPDYEKSIPVTVAGGDVYAQNIDDHYVIALNHQLHAGFITLEGALFDSKNKQLTDGAEQFLLSNRPSYASDFKNLKGEIYTWPAAKSALEEASVSVADYQAGMKTDFIAAAGDVSAETLATMLEKVKQGTKLVVKFDSIWAERLNEKGILSEKVTYWGAPQSGHWSGNGFGYIDYLVGETMPLNRRNVSLSGWEVSGAANAFEPFKSSYKTAVYGVYVARPDVIRTVIGVIDYGKGKIILNAAYPVDDQYPFNDLLFYNMLSMKIK